MSANIFFSQILLMIFDYLTPFDRKTMTETCHYVLSLINDAYGKKLSLRLSPVMDFSVNGSLYKTFQYPFMMRQIESFVIDDLGLFPDDALRVLQLCGSKVKNLLLRSSEPTQVREDILFGCFPNLETLSAPNVYSLPVNFTFPRSLKCTIFHNIEKRELEMLKSRHNIQHLSVHCLNLKLTKQAVLYDTTLFSDSLKEALLDFLKDSVSITIQTGNRLNDVSRLKLEDIRGIVGINNVTRSFPILVNFPNLQLLDLTVDDDIENIFCPALFGAFGKLKYLTLHDDIRASTLLKILKQCPSLESLEIRDADLLDIHFYTICDYQPKLKRLILDSTSQFTLHPLTDPRANKPSLKTLKHLEELVIKSNWFITNEFLTQKHNLEIRWPVLPKLKKLHLEGYAFKVLGENFIKRISRHFQGIKDLTLCIPRKLHQEILSILNGFPNKLTHLRVFGLGMEADWFDMNRSTVLSAIRAKGKELKELTLTFSEKCMTLSEITELLRDIHSLEKITVHTCPESVCFSRDNLSNMKSFVKKNISYFLNGLRDSTLFFISKEIMGVPVTYDSEITDLMIGVLNYFQFSQTEIAKLLVSVAVPNNYDFYDDGEEEEIEDEEDEDSDFD